jgi:hypothetical protein
LWESVYETGLGKCPNLYITHILQYLGISSPTDTCFGDVKHPQAIGHLPNPVKGISSFAKNTVSFFIQGVCQKWGPKSPQITGVLIKTSMEDPKFGETPKMAQDSFTYIMCDQKGVGMSRFLPEK